VWRGRGGRLFGWRRERRKAVWMEEVGVVVRLEDNMECTVVCRSVCWVVARWERMFTTLSNLCSLARDTSPPPSLLAVM
jgi:hypothetical protein